MREVRLLGVALSALTMAKEKGANYTHAYNV